MIDDVRIISVEFVSYKALNKFVVNLGEMNIVVGPNNAGKSTLLSAFRVLAVGLKKARHSNPVPVRGPEKQVMGYFIPKEILPISLENVHYNYDYSDSYINFKLSNKNSLQIYFPKDGGCFLIPNQISGKHIKRTIEFKEEFPITVAVVPILGPIEHNEVVIEEDTLTANINSQRASRYFRNYWYRTKDGFDEFAKLVTQTWPDMEVNRPERVDVTDKTLAMFCYENRIKRELYWCGSGFQVWCQMLTHINRLDNHSLVVVDEPEIYLHPDVQRQLVSILRRAQPDVLLATHSTEIMSEAEPTEILVVDKNRHYAQRLKDIEGVQTALDLIGSAQNITLTALARNNHTLFVEDIDDFKIIKRFAQRIGLHKLGNGDGITAINSGGFSSWSKIIALGWGIQKAMEKSLYIGVIYDRDYLCSEERVDILNQLKSHTNFAHIHVRKEIENYLLIPSVLDRTIKVAIADREKRIGEFTTTDLEYSAEILERLTSSMKIEIQGQYVNSRNKYVIKNERNGRDEATIMIESLALFQAIWEDINTRMMIVPGKDVLGLFRAHVKSEYKVNLSDTAIINNFKRDEIPDDLAEMIEMLDEYRKPT